MIQVMIIYNNVCVLYHLAKKKTLRNKPFATKTRAGGDFFTLLEELAFKA